MIYISPWVQAALLPDRWMVAGVSCSALSVWHMFILSQLGNAYVCDDPARMDKNAAEELLLYASRSHADGVNLYSMPFYRARAKRAVFKVLRGQEWQAVNEACQCYVDSCRRSPAHKEPVTTGKEKASRSCSAPLGWILADFMAQRVDAIQPGLFRSGKPRIEVAWDTPHAVACCLFDAFRNIEGKDDSLASTEEERRWESYRMEGA